MRRRAAAIGVVASLVLALATIAAITRGEPRTTFDAGAAACGGTTLAAQLERAAGITTSLTSLRVAAPVDSEVCHAALSNIAGATGVVLPGGRLRILLPRSLLIGEFTGGMLGPASASSGVGRTCSIAFPFSLFFGPTPGASPVAGSMVGSLTRRGILTPGGCRTVVTTLAAAVTLDDGRGVRSHSS